MTDSVHTPIDLEGLTGLKVCYGEPLSEMAAHRHDQVEINYAVGGSLTYLLAGSVARVEPGRFSMFWAGMPHSVLSSTLPERFYWVYVPLVWLLKLGLPESFVERMMAGEMIFDPEPDPHSDEKMLGRWCDELPDADEARHRLILREVEARVLRLALTTGDYGGSLPQPPENGPARKVADMARFVSENHSGRITVKDVAGYVGLHPNYAMTLFKRHYGMTLSAYLTRLRVCQAQNLLITTGKDTSRIAYEVGFGSVSRFYEAFREIGGCSPGQYRASSKGDIPRSPHNPCL